MDRYIPSESTSIIFMCKTKRRILPQKKVIGWHHIYYVLLVMFYITLECHALGCDAPATRTVHEEHPAVSERAGDC
jgi:hypothetical protein